jgi:hypothetical protein
VPQPSVQPILLPSPSASTIGYDEQCRMPHSGSSSNSSPKSTPSFGASSPGINNPAAAHGVATQTDDKARGNNTKLQQIQDTAGVTPQRPGIAAEPHHKHPPAGEHPSSRRSGTLQSLIRAEAAGRRRGLLEEDEITATTGSVSGRLKPEAGQLAHASHVMWTEQPWLRPCPDIIQAAVHTARVPVGISGAVPSGSAEAWNM